MIKRLHKCLHWIIKNPFLQLTAGLTLFIYTLFDQEQTALHHGFRFLIIWRAIPDLLQSLERITRGIK